MAEEGKNVVVGETGVADLAPSTTTASPSTPAKTPAKTPKTPKATPPATTAASATAEDAAASLQERIVTQVEFYFSDANLASDKFMLKHTGKHGTQPVPLVVLCAFKRMKMLTTDLVVVADALELGSTKLVVHRGEDGASITSATVARREPLPIVSLDAVKGKTVVAENLPYDPLTIDVVKEHFSKCGEVVLVRICTPPSAATIAAVAAAAAAAAAAGGQASSPSSSAATTTATTTTTTATSPPSTAAAAAAVAASMMAGAGAATLQLQNHPFKNDPILQKIVGTFALVEYATPAAAAAAALALTETNSWRDGMRVRVLGKTKAAKGAKGGRGGGADTTTASGGGGGGGASSSSSCVTGDGGVEAGEQQGGSTTATSVATTETKSSRDTKPPKKEAPSEEDVQRIANYKGFRRKSAGPAVAPLGSTPMSAPQQISPSTSRRNAGGGGGGAPGSATTNGGVIGAGGGGLPGAPRGPDGTRGFVGGRGVSPPVLVEG